MQAFENLYEIKFRYENTNLVVDNCPEKITKQIENKIKMLLASKYSKSCDMGVIPGLQKILDPQFYADVKNLESILNIIKSNYFLNTN